MTIAIAVLLLTFTIGFGFMQGWGASQWGPFSEWLASAVTLAAVVVALREAARARNEAARAARSRLVDHELSRRRESINALSDVWAAITAISIELLAFISYVEDLHGLNLNQPRGTPEVPDEPLADEVGRKVQTFYLSWTKLVEPPLFKALTLMRGSELYLPVKGLNADIRTMMETTLPTMMRSVFEGERVDVNPAKDAWREIAGRRNDHLNLAHEHFSLAMEDVERALGPAPS
ncbi:MULTISPECIES: hypothetical protein [Mycolicibacterium]|uniref:hypothetical protein n=1 Tax=Mycolicibacterium TaxID=1866885 RepID=UPI00056CCF13|nr:MULTISPECIES: hypothetical protein [Mycolicibacterium]QZY44872.1 hypothetical protein K5L12_21945 [Mycolicibacterium austroafricanum]